MPLSSMPGQSQLPPDVPAPPLPKPPSRLNRALEGLNQSAGPSRAANLKNQSMGVGDLPQPGQDLPQLGQDLQHQGQDLGTVPYDQVS